MNTRQPVLACSSEPLPLLDLVRGTAFRLNLEFCEFPSPDRVRHLLGTPRTIAVVAAPTLSDAVLAGLKDACSAGNVWLILVLGEASSETEAQAIEAGAIACVQFSQAMRTLAYLIRNLVKCVHREACSTPKALNIAGGVSLRIPEHILIGTSRDLHLTPITGRLLECLANHEGLAPYDELKHSAWGTPVGITDHALHQQIRRLREALAEFGASDSLKCLRGKGYILVRTGDGGPG